MDEVGDKIKYNFQKKENSEAKQKKNIWRLN